MADIDERREELSVKTRGDLLKIWGSSGCMPPDDNDAFINQILQREFAEDFSLMNQRQLRGKSLPSGWVRVARRRKDGGVYHAFYGPNGEYAESFGQAWAGGKKNYKKPSSKPPSSEPRQSKAPSVRRAQRPSATPRRTSPAPPILPVSPAPIAADLNKKWKCTKCETVCDPAILLSDGRYADETCANMKCQVSRTKFGIDIEDGSARSKRKR